MYIFLTDIKDIVYGFLIENFISLYVLKTFQSDIICYTQHIILFSLLLSKIGRETYITRILILIYTQTLLNFSYFFLTQKKNGLGK